MKYARIIPFIAMVCVFLAAPSTGQSELDKRRILVVSSYHKEYLWSQSTQRGLSAAMLRYGYIDNEAQIRRFAEEDYLESSRLIVKKLWMNTKRKHSRQDIARATVRIMKELTEFQPDLVMLGDDNAANYIGNQLLDTETPVVFWGINGLPLKYGLVDSMDTPGHNITGVWQAGYAKESLELLKMMVGSAKTFAVIACDSVSSRPIAKQISSLAARGELPLKLVDVVLTNSYSEFKSRVLELAERVDAFFVLNHDTLVDDDGQHVDMLVVGRWYLENIKIPEASHEDQFVREGMLLTANDSGYNQSYSAFEMAYDILEQGLNPSKMRTRTPARGPYMVNRLRAKSLGISIEPHGYVIDEFVDQAIALE